MRALAVYAALVVVIASCDKNFNKTSYTGGSHWNAGESLRILDGKYQACAGPAGQAFPDGSVDFSTYRISVERLVEGGGWQSLYEKSFPLSSIPAEMEELDATDIATFDEERLMVVFQIGSEEVSFGISDMIEG